MKSLFYAIALLALLGSYSAGAQAIPNSGLESWSVRIGRELPDNWQTTDDFYARYYGTYNTGTTTKTTDAHSGSFAAKLINVTVQSTTNTFVQEAYLSAGGSISAYALGGIPIGRGIPSTVRPTQLQFYYKNTGAATDTAIVLVLITRTVSGAPNTVGIAAARLAPVASYTAVNLPIQYDPSVSAAPDTAHITFTSGVANTLATTNSGLFIDDVSFIGTALATRADASTQALLTVAPNPSPGGRFVISSPDRPALAGSALQVLDALGRTVLQQPAQAAPSGQRELDLSGFSMGIYSLRLEAKEGPIVRQLTVK